MMSGRLRHTIIIEHVERTRDNVTGEEIPATRHIRTRADIKWNSGDRENVNGDIELGWRVTFIVWLYMRRHIGEHDIIIYDGVRHRIESIEPDHGQQILYLRATKENGQGL